MDKEFVVSRVPGPSRSDAFGSIYRLCSLVLAVEEPSACASCLLDMGDKTTHYGLRFQICGVV